MLILINIVVAMNKSLITFRVRHTRQFNINIIAFKNHFKMKHLCINKLLSK